MDIDIDAQMERTKNRSISYGKNFQKSGRSLRHCFFILGFIALHHHTNMVALSAACSDLFLRWIVHAT